MLYWSIFMAFSGTCYAHPNSIWLSWRKPVTSMSFCQRAVCSTYHTVLKASPGAAIFGQDMLFDIPFIADWQKIGEYRQWLTDLNKAHENEGRIDYDYKVGQKVLLRKEGILCNAESRWHKKPWLITTIHTNGTIMAQRRNKVEWMNIRTVKPFMEDLDNE